MALSTAQLKRHFWPMVTEAWKAHCLRCPLAPGAKEAAFKDLWRRQRTHEWLGVYSTKELSQTDDFDFIMMKFEELAGNGIRWRLRYAQGPARRLAHAIQATCREHDIEEDYARGLARRALQLVELPLFEQLSPKQLRKVLQVLKKQGARIGAAAHSTTVDSNEEGDPF